MPVLVDAHFNGTPRKLLMQASRNGYFFVLDRTTGKNLLTTPFATVNWAKGIDAEGRPIPNPDQGAGARRPAGRAERRRRHQLPLTQLRSGHRSFIVSAQDAYGIYFYKKEHGAYGWAGADYGVWSKGTMRALDYQTGKVRWNHDIGGEGSAGILTTATGLTFSGDTGTNVFALRTSDGTTLWHSSIGRVGNAPTTYELDGRQVPARGRGVGLYAWTLPGEPGPNRARSAAR